MWIIKKNGNRLGPWSAEEVRKALREGQLDAFDQASREGQENFMDMILIDEIFAQTPPQSRPIQAPDNTIVRVVEGIVPAPKPPAEALIKPSPARIPPTMPPHNAPVHPQVERRMSPRPLPPSPMNYQRQVRYEPVEQSSFILWFIASLVIIAFACALYFALQHSEVFKNLFQSRESLDQEMIETPVSEKIPPPLQGEPKPERAPSKPAKKRLHKQIVRPTPAPTLEDVASQSKPSSEVFSSVALAFATKRGQTVTISGLKFQLEDLRNCQMKCILAMSDRSGEKVDVVFFKGVYASKLEIDAQNTSVTGRLDVKFQTLLLSGVNLH